MWNPDYTKEFIRRDQNINSILNDKTDLPLIKEHYKLNPIDFIQDWCITYDPRNAGSEIPTTMPFLLFPKQKEFVTYIYSCINDKQNGLAEKSRDVGLSWICCAISVHLWLFYPGSAVGWGSRKQDLVDSLGDMKALFPKMRVVIEGLPRFFLPEGFDPLKNMSFMKIINPETGSSIVGEAGDEIGRGGRTTIYFKDESAHYARPERIEAALGDNTDVQIDISSVNGLGNIFHRRREAGEIWAPNKVIKSGKVRVFIFDWRDHPGKTQEWYDERKKTAREENLLHLFSQEVDRDYAAAIENTIIKGKWVKAAIDAHIKLGLDETGEKISALDVADGGTDKNAWGYRKGIVLKHIESWGGVDTDTTVTAQKAIDLCEEYNATNLQYDSIGVGAGVKGETNRLIRENKIDFDLEIIPWAGSGAVQNPDEHILRDENGKEDIKSRLNKDFFENLKAQGYWNLATMLYKTYRAVEYGDPYPSDELISLDSKMENLHELEKELCQPVKKQSKKGKMMIDKKPEGTRSPNLSDTVSMMYTPEAPKGGFFNVDI